MTSRRPPSSRARRAASLLVVIAAVGCASSPRQPSQNQAEDVTLIQARAELPEDQLLDVAIQIFDPGLPEPGEDLPPGVFEDVRRSEARFMAVRLSETLQGTGHWGAVRVAPPLPTHSDVTVSGRIVLSTGRKLVLVIHAEDATGRVWLDRKYREEADPAAYSSEDTADRGPFQNMYVRIANDLLLARQDRSVDELETIRQVARLRFASELLPEIYSDYLDSNRRGRLEVARLPAENDPMMDRIALIQEREAMFVDVLNQHYAFFAQQMEEPYDSWREFSYEELLALEEVRRKARTQKILGAIAVLGAILVSPSSGAEAAVRDIALLGGMAAVQAGFSTSKEAKIHKAALDELAASFDAEVVPMVVEVEGHTVRLTGSVEEQYVAWRKLLREIYGAETGLPADPNDPGEAGQPARSQEG
jgi:hypothetical protein